MRLLGSLAAVAAALLASCDVTPVANAPAEAAQSTAAAPVYPSKDATFLHWDRGHGYQAAYYADGDIWLWYPGNTSALRGKWSQERVAGETYLCFVYPRSSYNPVTKVRGGNKTCQLQAVFDAHLVAARSGDVFDLSSGRVPYVLRKNRRPDGM